MNREYDKESLQQVVFYHNFAALQLHCNQEKLHHVNSRVIEINGLEQGKDAAVTCASLPGCTELPENSTHRA